MTLGLGVGTAQGYYAATFQQTSYAVTALWISLHLGEPGLTGANPCVDTTRAEATTCFGTDPVVASGTVTGTNDAAIGVGVWDSATTAENPTHFAIWDDSGSGTFIVSGVIDGLDPGTNSIPAGAATFIYPTAT